MVKVWYIKLMCMQVNKMFLLNLNNPIQHTMFTYFEIKSVFGKMFYKYVCNLKFHCYELDLDILCIIVILYKVMTHIYMLSARVLYWILCKEIKDHLCCRILWEQFRWLSQHIFSCYAIYGIWAQHAPATAYYTSTNVSANDYYFLEYHEIKDDLRNSQFYVVLLPSTS